MNEELDFYLEQKKRDERIAQEYLVRDLFAAADAKQQQLSHFNVMLEGFIEYQAAEAIRALHIDADSVKHHIKWLKGQILQWQPIETAPKDGTDILGYCADYDVGLSVIERIAWRSGDWYTSEDFDFRPTHWMPLPEPPKADAPADQSAVQGSK